MLTVSSYILQLFEEYWKILFLVHLFLSNLSPTLTASTPFNSQHHSPSLLTKSLSPPPSDFELRAWRPRASSFRRKNPSRERTMEREREREKEGATNLVSAGENDEYVWRET